jgi:ADP-ribose pyrophosphatase YjhB (NUDIX family)
MSKLTRTWTQKNEIDTTDIHIPVRQVYVWILTTGSHVILVSKDSDTWQLPGGKPEENESLAEVAIREVNEETGIDISPYVDTLEFFGYYSINEPDSNPADYLQVRYLLNLPISSDMLALSTDHENAYQTSENIIRFTRAVSVHDITKFIPWMPTVEEYGYLVDAHVIDG